MGRKYQIHSQEYFYFVTFTIAYWIDIFRKQEYRNVFIDSVKYCQKEKGLMVGAWCIMPNHIHIIIRSDSENKLEAIIRDLKSYTSRHIRKYLENNPHESRKEWILKLLYHAGNENPRNNDFQLWQQHNHPIELSSNDLVKTRLNYLHNNPVKAGFVDEIQHWVHSSASDYAGHKGPIEIYFLD